MIDIIILYQLQLTSYLHIRSSQILTHTHTHTRAYTHTHTPTHLRAQHNNVVAHRAHWPPFVCCAAPITVRRCGRSHRHPNRRRHATTTHAPPHTVGISNTQPHIHNTHAYACRTCRCCVHAARAACRIPYARAMREPAGRSRRNERKRKSRCDT